MPIALDPRSLIAIAGAMSILMAVVLAFMRKNYPAHIHGLGYWAAAPATWLVATALYSSRGSAVSDLFSVVGANLVLMLGAIYYHAGCQRFMGHTPRWWWWGGYLGVGALAFSWLTFATPHYPARLVVFTALTMGIYGANLLFLLRHGSHRLPVRMVQIVLGVHLVVLAMRMVTPLMGMVGDNLMEKSLLQTAYISAYVLTVLMLSIGAVLMATDRLVAELELLATRDPLTRTLNRRAFLQHAQDEFDRSQRTGRGPALMMLDLDFFKTINDLHGHQHGDAVLVHFAQSTQSVLRGADRLGRYGGEEFVILLPETRLEDAQTVAARIHAALANGHALDCKLSIGLSAWSGPQDTLDALIGRADAALYQAKAQGRDRTCTA